MPWKLYRINKWDGPLQAKHLMSLPPLFDAEIVDSSDEDEPKIFRNNSDDEEAAL
jgi:hypothetical protein